MNKELEEQLYAINPAWFKRDDKKVSAMFWGFDCGNGWFELVQRTLNYAALKLDGDRFRIKKLEEDPEKFKFWDEVYKDRISPFEPGIFEVLQVKEKFGGLRFYYRGGTEEFAGYVHAMEAISYMICERCGQRGKERDLPWIRTLCDEHFLEAAKK